MTYFPLCFWIFYETTPFRNKKNKKKTDDIKHATISTAIFQLTYPYLSAHLKKTGSKFGRIG